MKPPVIIGGFFCIFITLAIYINTKPLIDLFFAQDDFYLLTIGKATNLSDFLNLFIPRSDTVWYRPLSQQVFFWFGQTIAGINPHVFHLMLLTTHIINSFLVYLFLNLIFKNKTGAVVGASFYALNPLHFLSLAWPAAYGFLLGPTLYISVLISYTLWLDKQRKIWFAISFVLFFISLLVIEVNSILPLTLLAIFIINFDIKKKKTELLHIIPFALLVGLLVCFRFFLYPPNVIGEVYQFSFGRGFSPLLISYSLRLLGLTQSLWLVTEHARTIHILTVLGAWAMIISSALLIHEKNLIRKKVAILGVVVTIIGLLPFLFLPRHSSPHYLSFALIGICMVIGAVFTVSRASFFVYARVLVTVFLFFLLSATGFAIEKQTHWIIRRAKLAEELVHQGIYEVPVGSEEYFALGANYAKDVYHKRK